MTYYDRVADLCSKQGFSVSNIGEHVKVDGRPLSNATVSGWKTGAKPRNKTLKAIADYFLVDVAWLRDGTISADDENEKRAPSAQDCLTCPCRDNCPNALDPLEKELVRVFRAATGSGQMRMIHDVIEILNNEPSKIKTGPDAVKEE